MIDFKKISKEWPEIISRKKAAEVTGGVVTVKTLANLDSLGEGPVGRVRLGKEICYPKTAFVKWLEGRAKAI